MKPIILFFILVSMMYAATPTEQRAWRSSAGTTVHASAWKIEAGKVHLRTKEGRAIVVPLEKFADEDRGVLADHFAVKAPEPGNSVASGSELIRGGLSCPVGETSGPVDAGDGSHYYVYVPKTLRTGRKAPMMLFTGAGGGSADSVNPYKEASELNGWIIATSVESINGEGEAHMHNNHMHAKRCVKHLMSGLPIDEKRVYFSGNSGGAAMAFYNAQRIESAGIMPYIGYSPDKKYSKKQYCYGIGGTSDFNRYLTANAASQFGNGGFHRMAVGGHDMGPEWVGNEGITWLNGRYLGDRRSEKNLDSERLDFEAAIIAWIKGLTADTPYRAHYWCNFMEMEYKITGPNAGVVGILKSGLEKDPLNTRYTAGIAAINQFSKKYFVEFGIAGSKFNHTTDKIRSAAEKLTKEYLGVPEIEKIARALGDPAG